MNGIKETIAKMVNNGGGQRSTYKSPKQKVWYEDDSNINRKSSQQQ